MYKQVVIDLETLGTHAGAAFVAVGAVAFDLDKGTDESDTFEMVVSLETALDVGTMTPGTLKWWMEQSSEAQRQTFLREGEDVETVLLHLKQFLLKRSEREDLSDVHVWGNSDKFDLGILEDKYHKCGIAVPWHYGREQNVRTVLLLAKHILGMTKPAFPKDLTPHRCLHDAIYQARYVVEMTKALGGKPTLSVVG